MNDEERSSADQRLDVFIAFVEEYGVNDQTRSLLTTALLVTDDERLWALCDAHQSGEVLQEDLLEKILLAGNSQDVAALLWTGVGRFSSGRLFSAMFQRLVPECSDARVLHSLVGAAVDFLRYHPGAFEISRELADRLLESQDPERRIIGLKALCRHCRTPPMELVNFVLGALKSENWSEACGGLHELIGLLERSQIRKETLTVRRLNELHDALIRVCESPEDDIAELRPMVEHCRSMLGEPHDPGGPSARRDSDSGGLEPGSPR